MSTSGSQELSDTAKSALQSRVLLVTGISHDGRPTGLEILECFGCERPHGSLASLVPKLIDGVAASGSATAARADPPACGFSPEAPPDPLAESVLRADRELRVAVVDSDDDRFEWRYRETRSSHLLAGNRPVMDGIRRERQMLSALRDRADLLIDPSLPTATQAERPFAVGHALADGGLRVFVTSFACLRGIPRAAYLLSDVPFLEDPDYIEMLRATDPAVSAGGEGRRDLTWFFDQRLWVLAPLLARCGTGSETLSDDCCRPHRWSTAFGSCRATADGKAV